MNLTHSRYFRRTCLTSYTMYSLYWRAQFWALESFMGLPMGTWTPSRSTQLVRGGQLRPTPFVECLPWGRLLALQSALKRSWVSPSATSHSNSSPSGFIGLVQQQLADLETMSAKYTPLPNMQPVTGASGGAILSPWLRIPTKLVRRLPCHNSILLGISLVNRFPSESEFSLQACRSSKWQVR